MGDRCYCVNLDLTKWNLNFRAHSVAQIAGVIDNLFGFQRVYKTAHQWFHHTWFFNNSRLKPPKYHIETHDGQMWYVPEADTPYCYHGHQGGMEGMHQKLWTIITLCIIEEVKKKVGVFAHTIGQGDNQVIIIKFPEHCVDDKMKLLDQFLSTLKDTFNAMGKELISQC